MSATESRLLALRVGEKVRTREAWVGNVLDGERARSSLSAEDLALATRLAYGVAQWTGTLDDALDRYIPHPRDVRPRVRSALRISAYELLFSDVPARAAVHQGVELAKTLGPGAAKLANAVLRRLADDAAEFPWGDPKTDPEVLARATGHPEWLVERLLADLGEAPARTMLFADTFPAPLYLAHNPYRCEMSELMELLAKEGAQPSEIHEIPGCILCAAPAAAVTGTALSDGLALVADAGAQFAAQCAIPPDGGTVVDVAAGRGTKTALILAGLRRKGRSAHVMAIDVHGFKAGVAQNRLAELGMPEVEFARADSTDPAALIAVADGRLVDSVLVDAPCSGLGTLRRHPEKKWRLRPEDIDSVANTAQRMLVASASLVRPGGFMVYSTCTVTNTENDQLVDSFLGSPAGERFSSADMGDRVPEGWGRFVNRARRVQIVPEQGGPDGHYVAVLNREPR